MTMLTFSWKRWITISEFRLELIEQITRPTARDKQRNIGPSELGNPCPKCVGRALAGERAQQSFSLYPWIGTAGHYYLEDHVFPDAEHELKLLVGEIEGYGEIRGTTDMYRPDAKDVVDWKFVGLKKLKTYRINGAPTQYRYQAMLYGRGCELSGREVETVRIAFIPRDSGDVRDIWVHEEAYQPEMAERALERGKFIFDYVQENGWDSLESDDDCYVCNNIW